MLNHRLNTENATATTCTTDSAASEKMAEDPVNMNAATLPTSISTPTIKDSRIAKRASRFCCSVFANGACSRKAVMSYPSLHSLQNREASLRTCGPQLLTPQLITRSEPFATENEAPDVADAIAHLHIRLLSWISIGPRHLGCRLMNVVPRIMRMIHFALSMRMGTLILCRTLVAVVPRNMSARKRWP